MLAVLRKIQTFQFGKSWLQKKDINIYDDKYKFAVDYNNDKMICFNRKTNNKNKHTYKYTK